MNLNSRYRLAEGVAVRPERFGGLAYHYHDRRLYFLHSHELTEFVRGLHGACLLGEAIETFRTEHDLPAEAEESILRLLATLEKMGLVVPVAA